VSLTGIFLTKILVNNSRNLLYQLAGIPEVVGHACQGCFEPILSAFGLLAYDLRLQLYNFQNIHIRCWVGGESKSLFMVVEGK
jgi:hypothetical protein